mgnify:FL=1
MAIQEYVSGEEFKKLVDDKIINANSVKHIIKKRGIFPVCTSPTALSDLVHTIFFGSGMMTEVHQAMNFEQNNMKSTVVVINPKMTSTDIDFITGLSDEFVRLQRLPSSPYELKNICKDDGALSLQYCYEKQQRGRMRLADTKEVTLDVRITQLPDGNYKVNIRHEGISESKQFVSLLEDMVKPSEDEQIFSIKRITLSSLQKANKVDFFDNFGAYSHKDWHLVDITNVTLNKNEFVIDDDADEAMTELRENEPTGKLTGISSAVLTGGGLRNNDFVKECMQQNFIFSSMRYKFQHKSLPITVEIDITFKQTDLKINITRTWRTEDDGKDYITPLPGSEQDEYIDYFQNVAYSVYSKLLSKQREEVNAANRSK